MSGVQLTFAILGSVLALGSLVWTITWAIKSFRKAGAEVTAELGQGYVDEQGTLHVYFRDGRSKIMRIEGDPWKKRKTLEKASTKRRRKAAGAPDQEHEWLPVNAIFARNNGRAAITVSRCFYIVELNLGTSFQFEPQPGVSPWGNLLPKRIEAGEEIVVLHEKENMSGLLNGVLRDHRVFQTSTACTWNWAAVRRFLPAHRSAFRRTWTTKSTRRSRRGSRAKPTRAPNQTRSQRAGASVGDMRSGTKGTSS
jgi:hypothetical protein